MTRLRRILIVATGWQLSCLALVLVYRPTIGRAVVEVYTFWFGDIQASYGTFERIGTYLGNLIVTAPVTGLTLVLLDFLSHQQRNWRRLLVVFLMWEAVTFAALVWSYETGFSYRLNQLDWRLFGPPDDLYSLRNLLLPRIIAWLLCTTPP